MIKIEKITPPTREFFDPEGNSIGFLNVYEFYALRVQAKKTKTGGYYSIYDNRKIVINENGKCSGWPIGFFDHIDRYLRQLIK